MAIKNGNNNPNTLIGTNSADQIFGLGGNDTLFGKGGNDLLNGGTGNDRMDGGTGNDVYIVNSTADVVVEAANSGTDTVKSSAAAYTLSANVEHLTLAGAGNINGTGNALNNKMIGNAGANILSASAGNDRLEGRDGIDTLLGSGGNDVLLGGNGNDSLDGSIGDDSLDGGAGADTMTGGSGKDRYVIDNVGDRATDADADSIVKFVSTPGVDEGLTGSGDRIEDVLGIAVIEGDDEKNCLSADGRTTRVTIIGNGGRDALQGGDAGDLILGGDGDDDFNAGTAVLVNGENLLAFTGLVGGSGNDTIDGGAGNDVLDGQNGDDSLIGGTGNDLMAGGNDNDSLIGGDGNDSLSGNNGNDRLDGGAGIDTMVGGFGDDTFVVNSVLDSISENDSQGADRVLAWVSFSLFDPDIENLILANEGGNIHGTGNAVVNTMIGSMGHNVLRGLSSNDTLQGRDGNDTLDGGTGADRMEGGAGDDTYIVDDLGDVVAELQGEGVDRVLSFVSFTLDSDVDHLTLLGGAVINGIGNARNNIMIGNSGANSLGASGGNDTLIGNEGNDSLGGSGGDDVLDGGFGDDTLNGSLGNDIMTGGLGSDEFRYDAIVHGTVRAVNGALPAGTPIDHVTDFFGATAGNGTEFFEFASAAFSGGVLGNGPVAEGTSFSIIGSAFNGTNAGVNANHDAGLATFVFSTADRILYHDGNGDAAGYTAIAMLDTGTVAAGDIIINP